MTIKKIPYFTRASFFIIATLICTPRIHSTDESTPPQLGIKDFNMDPAHAYELKEVQETKYSIDNVYILGNNSLSSEAILVKSLLQPKDIFDVNKTSQTIKNIYATGYFEQVKIAVDIISEDQLDLYIIVQEKPKLHHVTYNGNKHFSIKDLNAAIDLEHIPAINDAEINALIAKIIATYQKKSYHHVQVTGRIEKAEQDGQSDLIFDIVEGKTSFVEQISFKGNKSISSAQLKKFLYSKEEWILSILDKSGSYHPGMVDADKAMIADVYKSNGYMKAQVTQADVQFNEQNHNYKITYHVYEGQQYFIEKINAPGNDILSEEVLKSIIPLKEGMPYSTEKIRNSIEILKTAWSDFGYIFADIEPAIEVDEKTLKVTVSFYSEINNKFYLNRLKIRGNKKTIDKVVRRQILLDEGELITNRKMDFSKNRVQLLNYFDAREGVNWKINKIDDEHADLELLLKEVKTGKFNSKIGFGGAPGNKNSPSSGFSGGIEFGDRNLWGSGIDADMNADVSKQFQSIQVSLRHPWIFDKPIRGQISGYHKRSEYVDEINLTQGSPEELTTGGFFGSGYVARMLGTEILIDCQLGLETIRFKNKPVARGSFTSEEQAQIQTVLDKNFQSGDQWWTMVTFAQDRRNGIVFPTEGHQFNWQSQLALPITNSGFKYFRTEFDFSWYTPLIAPHTLILCLHAHVGFIKPLSGKNAPWRNLFHIGGPATVRGYTYGQIGPMYRGDSIGASKAFHVNAELIIPITADLNTRAVFFYDGGAGWDNPYVEEWRKTIPYLENHLENNKFFYRHSVGVGFRMKSPTPIQVDFGIKLNPAKKYRKLITQMHLSMEHSF